MTMKIKNKMLLRDKLNHGDYKCIGLWKDGCWVEIGYSMGRESSGEKPVRTYSKAAFGEMTHKEITALFHSIEMMVLEDR